VGQIIEVLVVVVVGVAVGTFVVAEVEKRIKKKGCMIATLGRLSAGVLGQVVNLAEMKGILAA